MHLRLVAPPLALVLALACKPDNDPGASTSLTFQFDSGAENGDETMGMGVTSSPTDPSMPTDGDASSNGPTLATSGTSDATDVSASVPGTLSEATSFSSSDSADVSSSSATTVPEDCADPLDQPDDSTCTDSSGCGCASGKCFLVPIFGGSCGECLVDDDCDGGGCSLPNPNQGTGAHCNNGEAGGGCMSDAACNDPDFSHCAEVLDIPGILTASTCSQCVDNGDCPGGQPHCTPQYDILGFSGLLFCAATGSVPNGQGCTIAGGDAACESGFCAEASVMGLLVLGVCSECEIDAHCPQGETCDPPQVDIGTGEIFPGACF